VGRVVGAISRTGAGTTGRVDQRDLRFWFAPAEMYRGEHARSSTTHDRDADHDGMLYLAGGQARDIGCQVSYFGKASADGARDHADVCAGEYAGGG
jgi:hypothetical protein